MTSEDWNGGGTNCICFLKRPVPTLLSLLEGRVRGYENAPRRVDRCLRDGGLSTD